MYNKIRKRGGKEIKASSYCFVYQEMRNFLVYKSAIIAIAFKISSLHKNITHRSIITQCFDFCKYFYKKPYFFTNRLQSGRDYSIIDLKKRAVKRQLP